VPRGGSLPSALTSWAHRLQGVDNEVEDDLLKPDPITCNHIGSSDTALQRGSRLLRHIAESAGRGTETAVT
jgi:hypothetical protein